MSILQTIQHTVTAARWIILRGGGFPHFLRNFVIQFAIESQRVRPLAGLANFIRSKRMLTRCLPVESTNCAKLMKPLGGEVAEWLNAAVC